MPKILVFRLLFPHVGCWIGCSKISSSVCLGLVVRHTDAPFFSSVQLLSQALNPTAYTPNPNPRPSLLLFLALGAWRFKVAGFDASSL